MGGESAARGVSPADVTVTVPARRDRGCSDFSAQTDEKSTGTGAVDEESIGTDDDTPDWLKNYQAEPRSLAQFLPVLAWVPAYVRTALGKETHEDARQAGGLPYSWKGDLTAGLTVGFMLVPQSLAFAMLAGLPVQTGLYASFAPLVVYAALGTIRQVQPGPTALMSLITGQALDSLEFGDVVARIEGAALIAFFVGAISIVLGVLRVGFIVDFMAHSVMAAFCAAAGVTIATSQIQHMLGIKIPRQHHWWETVVYLVTHLDEADPPTVLMGAVLLMLLFFLKYWKSAGSEGKRSKHLFWRWFPKDRASCAFKCLRGVADMSPLISVLIGWFWGLLYRMSGVDSVRVVGPVDSTGFKFTIPIAALGPHVPYDSIFISSLVMSVVGFLETMAVGGKFAMQARYDYDPNQELLALGFANIGGAVMHGYPVTGSFSRTAVNAMFGATSLVACFVSSVLVLLAILFLLPVVAWLPLVSLAPIIIQGAIGVISCHDFVSAFKASKAEFFVMVATFVVSLALSVKEGLVVGFVLSIMKTMRDLANPNMAVCGRLEDGNFRDIRNFPHAEVLPGVVVVRMDARLSFANARKMKEFIIRAVCVREMGDEKKTCGRIGYVVIDAKSMNHVDLTGCEMLEALAETLHTQGQRLIVANLKGPVLGCLSSVREHLDRLGGCLCTDMEQALQIIKGGDNRRATREIVDLAHRVETANLVLHSGSPINKCMSASRRKSNSQDPTSPAGKRQSRERGLGPDSPQTAPGFELHLPVDTPEPEQRQPEPVDEELAAPRKKAAQKAKLCGMLNCLAP